MPNTLRGIVIVILSPNATKTYRSKIESTTQNPIPLQQSKPSLT